MIQVKDNLLLKPVFWISAQNPVLRPFSAIYVALRVVIPDSFFLGDVVLVSCNSCTFGGRQIESLLYIEIGCRRGLS